MHNEKLHDRIRRQEELTRLSVDELTRRMEELSHAVQSGVAFRLAKDATSGNPKHLRTGLDISKAEEGGLARLLVRKGLVTEAEYFAACVEGLELENELNEAWANAQYGRAGVISFA